MRNKIKPEALLTPAEVAIMFRVDPKTVTRWAKAGRLSSLKTLGGHRRYREAEVLSLLHGRPVDATGHEDVAPVLSIVTTETSGEPAVWRAGLSGDTVTVEGRAIVFRRDGDLVKAIEDLPDGTDLVGMAKGHAVVLAATFVQAVAS